VIGGRVLDRVVVVLGYGQGSGVLLNPRTVLTAWHVVSEMPESGRPEVAHPFSREPVPCRVSWYDEARDVAELIAETDVISPELAAPLGRLRYGRVATGNPLPHCQIVGFPHIQRYGVTGEDLEYDQYAVSVLPVAGALREVLVCELDHPLAAGPGEAASPLAGLSGAPVFAGPVLMGLVTQVPRARLHHRIEGVAIDGAVGRRLGVRFRDTVEQITDVHPHDEQFEARYAKDLSSQYRRTEIFGIEELGRSESRWDLDTAYLSLRAEAAPDTGGTWSSREPDRGAARRIEDMLTSRPRALLRGEAGAGKTTLVWWLAAHAANGTLSEELTQLNGLVPFVIPLREVHARGGGFPSVAQLLSAGRVITDGPPEGWARRVLEAGRGLLLVDGLDEVPAPEREHARRWLSALLDRYPDTRCLATVRPNAVDEDWLGQERFAELTLLPMSDEDIAAFVHAWHNAARLECDHFYDTGRSGEERGLLTSLERALGHQLEQNTALRDLARTPLLCAVICALHRRRRGLLPTSRWSLYRAALAMLLGGRDSGRGVLHADRVRLDSDDQHALLQRLAIWLVRTGQQQMTHEQATGQLDLAMRDMPEVREQGTPERVLRFLLDRSGLLLERADDAVQFIHRTFQDFLAAKEFHESGYLPELLEHADNEAWRDVLVLAVGHTSRHHAEQLIAHLIGLGDSAGERERRCGLHVLAARCAVSLRQLNADLTEAVVNRVNALLPPRTPAEVDDIASLGEWTVDMQPDSEEQGVLVTRNTVRLLARMRSDKATQKLKRLAAHPEPLIRSEVAAVWDFRPLDEYATEVLAGMHVPEVIVDRREKLVRLPEFGSAAQVAVVGSYSAGELADHLGVPGLVSLQLHGNKTIDSLTFLRDRRQLTRLEVWGCPKLRDLSVLPKLDLECLMLGVDTAGTLPPLPGVRDLTVAVEHTEWLEGLDAWPRLEMLSVSGYNRDASGVLRAAFRAPRVTWLALGSESLDGLSSLSANPRVRHLRITGLRDHSGIGELSRVFPRLAGLELGLVKNGPAELDLRELVGLPDLELGLWGEIPAESHIVGAEEFVGRLHFGTRH
jgi:hypothetical protein